MINENNKNKNSLWRIFPLLTIWLLLFSCNTTKYLQDDEAFLKKNEIILESPQKIRKEKKLMADLTGIIQQKPNKKFLVVNRRWFYYKSKKKRRDKKRRRLIAELPSIYSEDIANSTAESMQFLLEQKGYYNAEVSFETTVKKKQASVLYTVQPKNLFTVDSILFVSKDTSIQNVLNGIHSETVLKKGMPVSNQLFKEEKQRITLHLKNSGYKNFDVRYIDQLATKTDSAQTKSLKLSLEVFPVTNEINHKKYHIGDIYVFPFYNPQTPIKTLADTIIDGIHFRYAKNIANQIKPDVIARRIFLKKGDTYSLSNDTKTRRNLGELGIFKFVNIEDKIANDSLAITDFYVFLTANQRRNIGGNLEYKNTSLSESSPTLTGRNFNGGEISLSYQDKNALGGAELFNANIRFGGQFGNDGGQNFLNSYDINPQFDLRIPKFRDLFGIVKVFNKVGVFSDRFYNSLLDNASTRLSLGVSWSERRDFWGYFSTDLSLGYEITNNPDRKYFVKQLGINIFNPKVVGNGISIFADRPFLERTFNNSQLFTGILLKEFGFTFEGRKPEKNSSWRLFLNSEVSGVEALAVKGIANQFRTVKKDTFQLFGVDFAHFVRFDLDGRYYKFLNPEKSKSFAFRLNMGIASPFVKNQEVPYVKQFLAGGPNSVRAWRVRELGPGSYRDPSTFPQYTETSQPFYQTGDFKLIFNAEYQFLLFRYFGFDWKGALFLDGGNVWTLKKDPDRPGSELTDKFYQQIALGTGAGIRVDFRYFILRFDFGYKLRNPYPNPEGSYWAKQEFQELGFKGINSNLAVGYAF